MGEVKTESSPQKVSSVLEDIRAMGAQLMGAESESADTYEDYPPAEANIRDAGPGLGRTPLHSPDASGPGIIDSLSRKLRNPRVLGISAIGVLSSLGVLSNLGNSESSIDISVGHNDQGGVAPPDVSFTGISRVNSVTDVAVNLHSPIYYGIPIEVEGETVNIYASDNPALTGKDTTLPDVIDNLMYAPLESVIKDIEVDEYVARGPHVFINTEFDVGVAQSQGEDGVEYNGRQVLVERNKFTVIPRTNEAASGSKYEPLGTEHDSLTPEAAAALDRVKNPESDVGINIRLAIGEIATEPLSSNKWDCYSDIQRLTDAKLAEMIASDIYDQTGVEVAFDSFKFTGDYVSARNSYATKILRDRDVTRTPEYIMADPDPADNLNTCEVLGERDRQAPGGKFGGGNFDKREEV